MNIFEYYIKKSRDNKVIYRISKIQEDYKKHSNRICEIILQLGGVPIEISHNYDDFDNYIKTSKKEIFNETCEVSSKGVTLGYKLIHDPDFLNHESYNLINLITKDYQRHINLLER